VAWRVAGAGAQACANPSCELEAVGVEGAAGLPAGGGEADVRLFVCGGKDGRDRRDAEEESEAVWSEWWRGGIEE